MDQPNARPRPVPTEAEWDAIGRESFVSLGTYRKNGEVVATAVWMARDGDDLVVTTEVSTGKVKRLRNDPQVRMQPCGRLGKVEPGAPTLFAEARIAGRDRSGIAALQQKYGLQFRVFLSVERFIRKIQKRTGQRTILRISRPAAS